MKAKILFGLILVAIGVVIGGNSLEFWDFELFFDGWWTVFIILPGLFALFQKQWISGLISIAIGTGLLLAANDIIPWALLGPIALIAVGLCFIFARTPKNQKDARPVQNSYTAIFSGNDSVVTGEVTKIHVRAIFGGVELDLRQATVSDDAIIDCLCLFGGIDIIAPENVSVTVSGTPIFGGIENKVRGDFEKTLTLNCVCAFGGVDIE